ncbi:IMPACT family protein [Desulforhopalus singaporensis]|uniref:Uncharacterized protein, YigZ family n=1 Tax=Desulforhopalus singaporensis TaxID=91360 RepID=A0A1H0J5Q1_9BACT|nr:YigZ family protein [Desulforhopalus singaporensis]SDO38789.1 uncharacterized protein, YigZ family [Desulforhopalus singaporensis]
MAENGRFLVVTEDVVTEFYEKKSRFISSLATAGSKVDAERFIKNISSLYPGANHNCFAYIVGDPLSPLDIHCSDDGEPSGTAGRPMLSILERNRIGNAVVVVTRYFGGTKLGTGGLVRAYSRAVKEAVEQAQLAEYVERVTVTCSFHYQFEAGVRNLVATMGACLEKCSYLDSVTCTITMDVTVRDLFIAELKDLTSGRVTGLE